MMFVPVNRNNCIAIEVLEQLSIKTPSQSQIDLMESIISNVTVKKSIFFAKSLSKREKSCLYWSAKGKTSEEIARLLKIQKQTVDGHKKEIKRKLGCKTITQSVFEGMRFDYLPMQPNVIGED